MGRTPALTRAIREFRKLIANLSPAQLSMADRAAFRRLYRELSILASAAAHAGAPGVAAFADPGRCLHNRAPGAATRRAIGVVRRRLRAGRCALWRHHP
jgi:hypothetical protein